MTANQIVALGFPLVTLAAVGLTGLFVRRWTEIGTHKPEPEVRSTDSMSLEALTEADRLIQQVRGRLAAALTTPKIDAS
jgi:hypothetical protein